MTCLKPVSYLATSPSLQLLWLLFCEPQPWLHRLESIISWQKMSVFSINNVRWSNIYFCFSWHFQGKTLFWTRWDSLFFLSYISHCRKRGQKQEFKFCRLQKQPLDGVYISFPSNKSKINIFTQIYKICEKLC